MTEAELFEQVKTGNFPVINKIVALLKSNLTVEEWIALDQIEGAGSYLQEAIFDCYVSTPIKG